MSDGIVIYVKDGCPYCAAARAFYAEQQKSVTEINVPKTPGARDALLTLTGGKAIVPVIVGNGPVQIGFGGG